MTDPDTWQEQWKSYIGDFDRMKLSFDGDEYERIGEIQEELEDLVDEKAEELKEEEQREEATA